MLRKSLHTGLIVAGLAGLFPAAAFASGPSDQCRDGASQCRDAFAKLETCQKNTKKAEKPEANEGEESKDSKEAKDTKTDAESCASERAATDAACKTSNTACVKDGSRHAPHARKG